jgi:hypothetical protein
MHPDRSDLATDAPLFVVPRMLARLRAYRDEVGVAELEELADRLLAGIEAHPTRFWVLKQCQRALEAERHADGEVRQQVRSKLERLMEIVGVTGPLPWG